MLVGLWFGVALAGPFEVGSLDVEFVDAHYGRGTVEGRVYFPATAGGAAVDRSGGPYPLVAHMHGWLGNTDVYDEVCEAIATEGFVVASINTQTGLILNVDTFAQDTHALIAWVEDQSADAGSEWSGLVDHADLTAMGHSMGGATLGSLVDLEPRVRTVVGFMPYVGEAAGYEAMATFDGSALYFAGTDDTTAPTFMAQDWFETADNADRSLFVEIGGGGHQAVLDVGFWSDGSLDFDVQLDLVKGMASAFVRSEVRGEEDLWAELVGPEAPPELVQTRSAGHAPVFWGQLDGDTAALVGVAGRPGAEVTFLASADEALSAPVELGSATLVDGLAFAELSIADWTDDLYLQAVVEAEGSIAPSRTLALITDRASPPTGPTGTTQPTDPTAGPTDPTDPGGDPAQGGGAAGTGCATGPAPLGLAWLLLPLVARRRP